jgi:hypothetical protein
MADAYFSPEQIAIFEDYARGIGINTMVLPPNELNTLYFMIAKKLGIIKRGPAPARFMRDTAVVNSNVDKAYAESLAKDDERAAAAAAEANAIDMAKAADAARKQARQIEEQRFIAEFTSQYLNDGDVTIQFDYRGVRENLNIKVSTPIDQLAEYASCRHHLDNVQLFLYPKQELQPGHHLSDYLQKGNRVKIIIEGDMFEGGFKVRNSLRNKTNLRKSNKRQPGKRQTSKRQTSKRQNSKRQTSKRQNRKRMF